MKDNFIIIADNKKVKRNYHIIETIISGLVLLGWETRSIKKKSVSINDSYVYFEKEAFYVFGINITPLSTTTRGKNFKKRDKIKILLKKKRDEKNN